MFQKKIIPLLLLVLILAACAPAGTPGTPAATEPSVINTPEPTPTYETFHFKLGTSGYASDAPYYIANEEGFFAEQGLEVEFVRFEKVSDLVPALISGDLDAVTVIVTPGLFNAIAQDATLKIVAGKGIFDPTACEYSALMISPETKSSGRLDDPANWVGMKIAEQRGSVAVYAIDLLLQQNGLSLEDIEIVDMPIASRQEALKNGAVDVAVAIEPWITRFTNSGGAVFWQGLNNILPNFPLAMVAYGPTLLEEHPEIGQRFMIAFMKGVAQYNEGKTPRNVEIIAQYTQLAPEEVEQSCWQVILPDGGVDVQSMLDFQTWAIAKGMVEVPVTAEEIYDPSFIEFARGFLP